MQFIKQFLVLSLSASLLAGCGFQLRGSANIPDTMNALSINCGDAVDPKFCLNIQWKLQKSGHPTVPQENAEIILDIDQLQDERRAISVTRNAIAAEYELTYRLDFHLTLKDGLPLLPSATVKAARTYRFDETKVLSKAREEEQLREEMFRELSDSLIRRLSPFNRARITEIRHKHNTPAE